MPSSRSSAAASCAAAVALALAGTALAASEAVTTIDVSPRVHTAAPDESPADFPGVTRIRRGEPLPRGWIVVSRDVRIVRGDEAAYGALRMTCPKRRTWRSGTSRGDIAASVLDRNARTGKRSVLVMATFSTAEIAVGELASGTVYALCR